MCTAFSVNKLYARLNHMPERLSGQNIESLMYPGGDGVLVNQFLTMQDGINPLLDRCDTIEGECTTRLRLSECCRWMARAHMMLAQITLDATHVAISHTQDVDISSHKL